MGARAEHHLTTLVLPRVAIALAALRAIQWPIRRLGPYSCVLGFLLLGVLCAAT